MFGRKFSTKLLPIFALVAVAWGSPAMGSLIIFDTSTGSPWTVSGAGANEATPYYLATPEITITSTSDGSGQFATGGSNDQFSGLWYADYTFTLPSDAQDVELDFTNLVGSDRVVMQLNGTDIGDYDLDSTFANPPLTGAGEMQFPSDASADPYTFTGITSGDVTSGFVIGGVNDLRLVVNNTLSETLSADTSGFGGISDTTNAGVLGTVSYLAVPEPAGMLTVLAVGTAMLLRRPRAVA
jgi:hypothetical protein